ncbi:alpha-methylacyl-CoA racemase-like [Ptychodera flava]|uniref:alpha-methylacyl-CoA racemase-like n=1 Tax=Ptychodera flava TaxID=63121 RepID=UPI00396A0BDE
MALTGIRVLEMAGLAPAPMAGMILSDFGAKVVRVDRVKQSDTVDRLARGKKSIAVDVKSKEGTNLLRKLCLQSDVLIDPYRPGVMENMGLGPDSLMKEHPELIYARLTGFGQYGPFKSMAGHDLNYLSISGVLSMLGRRGENPLAPVNLLADFAGGGVMCSMGIMMALFDRTKTGKGQIVDASMVEGAAYVGSWLWRSQDMKFAWPTEVRGKNLLDSGAPFYDTYMTKDGKYMAVGAIEPQFYALVLKGLDLTEDELPGSQMDVEQWPKVKEVFAEVFATKTQSEWCSEFDSTDACVTPVLSLEGAATHPHNASRGSFFMNQNKKYEPRPAPRLSATTGISGVKASPLIGQHTKEVLLEAGFSDGEIARLADNEIIEISDYDELD